MSVFRFLELPAAFGTGLLLFGLILFVAPYLAGGDFGIFRVPRITESGAKKLK